MAWTDPKTWTSEVMSSSDLNTHLRDNLNALKDPPTDLYTFNEGTDYTTSSTSFADVDGTDLLLTIVTSGGDVIVHFDGYVNSSGGSMYLDFTVDNVRHGGDDGVIRTSAGTFPVSFTRVVEGLSAASHDFKLQWKMSAGTGTIYAGAGTSQADMHPQMWVREVS